MLVKLSSPICYTSLCSVACLHACRAVHQNYIQWLVRGWRHVRPSEWLVDGTYFSVLLYLIVGGLDLVVDVELGSSPGNRLLQRVGLDWGQLLRGVVRVVCPASGYTQANVWWLSCLE
jgi:hypothetical protein